MGQDISSERSSTDEFAPHFDSSFASKLPTQDAKSIVESMYGENSEAVAEIERIVEELEGRTSQDDREESRTQKTIQAKAAEDIENQRRAKANRRAESSADSWLRRQQKPEAPQAPTDDPNPPPPPPVLAVFTGQKRAPKKDDKKQILKPVPEFYMLLGVSVDATFEEIKKGYRSQALKWHPDKNRDKIDEASERFKRINEAFDTLYDPAKRDAYDCGKNVTQGKLKKIQGCGWSKLPDEDDAVLTPFGVKIKKQSWRNYIMFYGRIDDDPEQLVTDDRDPRAPLEKLKLFWRLVGEYAYLEREEGGGRWLQTYLVKIWKDTPTRWPTASEIQSMNDSAQQEWKERRMVYSRRKSKVLLHVSLHEDYLDIPDREAKEIERIKKMRPAYVAGKGVAGGVFFKNVS